MFLCLCLMSDSLCLCLSTPRVFRCEERRSLYNYKAICSVLGLGSCGTYYYY